MTGWFQNRERARTNERWMNRSIYMSVCVYTHTALNLPESLKLLLMKLQIFCVRKPLLALAPGAPSPQARLRNGDNCARRLAPSICESMWVNGRSLHCESSCLVIAKIKSSQQN